MEEVLPSDTVWRLEPAQAMCRLITRVENVQQGSRRLCFKNSDSFGSRQLLALCNEYMEMKRFRQQDFL